MSPTDNYRMFHPTEIRIRTFPGSQGYLLYRKHLLGFEASVNTHKHICAHVHVHMNMRTLSLVSYQIVG